MGFLHTAPADLIHIRATEPLPTSTRSAEPATIECEPVSANPDDPSLLARRLDSGRFTITAELVPPVSSDPADVLARAAPLKGLVAAVNVTDGAGARAHL